MRTLLKLNLASCILLLSFTYACKKKDKTVTPDDPTATTFDRKVMLANMGSNVIVPAYQAFAKAASSLDSAVTDFNLAPDNTKLLNLQTVFKNAYRHWQSASSFDFGPADQEYFSQNVNTFPTDTTKINANISSGSYNINALSNLDARGLPALDYMLFGASNNSLLVKFTTDSKAANRKAYMTTVSAAMKTNATNVVNGWNTYMSTFINATGTDVGSSIGQMINEMDEDLEVLKNYKLGIPLGKQSMGTVYPAKVEAYYTGFSSELALLQLKSIQNIYGGYGVSGNQIGLDDFLVSVNAQYNGGSLNTAILNQFTAAITKLQAVPDPLSTNITTNQALVNAAYTEVQKLVVLLKTDMPSSLGVLITYEDNDGD